MKRGKVTSKGAESITLPRTPEESLAEAEGVLAMMAMSQSGMTPGDEAYDALVRAAEIDPSAAYNLGNILSSSPMQGTRPLKHAEGMAMLERAVTLGMERLDDPEQDFEAAPEKERSLRDIISRALTNIGGEKANAEKPREAVPYFWRSIKIYPDNPVSHDCLGIMAIFNAAETELDPMEGLRAWEEAQSVSDTISEPVRSRINAVRIGRQIERDYGVDAARSWLSKRYPAALSKPIYKEDEEFALVVEDPNDIARVTGHQWPKGAIDLAKAMSSGLLEFSDRRIEWRVTLAASILGTICKLSRPGEGIDAKDIEKAVEKASIVEPLSPLLGDDQWEVVRPPASEYLRSMESLHEVRAATLKVLEPFVSNSVVLPNPFECALGALFHLDKRFRGGVSYMLLNSKQLGPEQSFVYIPATYLGASP